MIEKKQEGSQVEHIKGQVRLGDYHSLAFVYPIWDTDGEAIAFVDAKQLGRERAANIATEIVLAVNAYDALVAACEALLDLATWASGAPVFNPGGDAREGWLKVCSAIDKGHAALALVKGGTSE